MTKLKRRLPRYLPLEDGGRRGTRDGELCRFTEAEWSYRPIFTTHGWLVKRLVALFFKFSGRRKRNEMSTLACVVVKMARGSMGNVGKHLDIGGTTFSYLKKNRPGSAPSKEVNVLV